MTKMGRVAQQIKRYGLIRTTLCVVNSLIPYKHRGPFHDMLMLVFRLLTIKQFKTRVNQTELFLMPKNNWVLYKYFILARYDEREIALVQKCIPQHYSFVDVGANFGAWTFSLAGHFARTIAFEPDPECFDCLEKTKKLHSDKNGVSLFNAALADENKEGILFPSKSNKGDGRIYDPLDGDRLDGIKIRVRSFDSIVQEKNLNMEYVFLKLDAQGAEPWVLKGMQNSLSKAKDVILWMEVQSECLESAGENMNGLFSLLKDLGFKPADFENNFETFGWNEKVLDLKKNDFCFRLQRGVREN